MTTNILVTAAGSPGFITVCKAILSHNPSAQIHGCDINPNSVGLRFTKNSFVVPPGNHPEYAEAVFTYCWKNRIEVLIPGADEELIPLSKEKSKFEDIGCKILVSDSDSLEKILNKSNLYSECSKISSLKKSIPEYLPCSNLDDFIEAYNHLRMFGHDVCVKPAVTHGSRGFRVIRPTISKKDFFEKKPDPRSITLKSIIDILGEGDCTFPELLVMEYLPGEEFSVDCIQINNEFYCVTRRRDTIKDGICSSGEAIKKDDLINLSRDFYQNFNLKYNTNLQFRYDANGNPKLLEINPRLSGTLELCRGAGINFVSLGINTLLKNDLETVPEIKWGTKMQRVWEEVFFCDDKTFTLENVNDVLKQF
ncbi:MAG TPA: hypothetical protein EYG21_05770 [Nitrospinaceae bacterium]|jgi:carbamoyl-phosphate synthase large subunit|nr:hypothetical protein [Nitrospinaceae bacterium]